MQKHLEVPLLKGCATYLCWTSLGGVSPRSPRGQPAKPCTGCEIPKCGFRHGWSSYPSLNKIQRLLDHPAHSLGADFENTERAEWKMCHFTFPGTLEPTLRAMMTFHGRRWTNPGVVGILCTPCGNILHCWWGVWEGMVCGALRSGEATDGKVAKAKAESFGWINQCLRAGV